ncbi:unnamed protein product [Lactuca saligna]|uniref:Uncharacterized protein n=1 Tax=Lactuca saligna TaxID=75948 RepID=A0AA35YJ99_LACSI|nr:unnamed protein product [Lactuca saligna]
MLLISSFFRTLILQREHIGKSGFDCCADVLTKEDSDGAYTSRETLVMSTQLEELMKKLEAFMIQQTQSNNDLKTSTNDLKATMTTLQTKQAAMEERLQTLTQNKSNRQEEEDENVDNMFESDRFDDPSEQVRRRGRGATFGANPNSKFLYQGGFTGRGKGVIQEGAGKGSSKAFETWRTGEHQPFKHHWDSLKPEGSNRIGRYGIPWGKSTEIRQDGVSHL